MDPQSPIVIRRQLFAEFLVVETSSAPTAGLKLGEFPAGRGNTVLRYLTLDWEVLAGPSLYWRRRESGEQSLSNEGELTVLQALLVMDELNNPMPELYREALEFRSYIFSPAREPLPASLERRLAVLRRRVQLAVLHDPRAFRCALDPVFSTARLSDYLIKRSGLTPRASESVIDLGKVRKALGTGQPVKLDAHEPEPLSATAAEEVAALLLRQRTGVFVRDAHVGVYLPTYVEGVWDAQLSPPWLAWADYCAKGGGRFEPGQLLPTELRTALQRNAAAWLTGIGRPYGEDAAAKVWVQMTGAVPYGPDVLVLRRADVEALAQARPGSVTTPVKVREMRPREFFYGGKPLRYYLTQGGVVLDPACLRFTSLDDLQARYDAAHRPAESAPVLATAVRRDAPVPTFRKLCHKVNDALYVHVGVVLELFAEAQPALCAALRAEFERPRAEIHARVRVAEVERKRTLGVPVRARFPFSQAEDAKLWETYRRYSSGLYWQDVQKAMPRHATPAIKQRARALDKAKKKGLTLEQARDRAQLEKVLGRYAPRYAAVLDVEP